MAVVSNRTPCNNKMFLKEINIPLINLIDKRRLFEFSLIVTRIVVSRYKIYSYMNITGSKMKYFLCILLSYNNSLMDLCKVVQNGVSMEIYTKQRAFPHTIFVVLERQTGCHHHSSISLTLFVEIFLLLFSRCLIYF